MIIWFSGSIESCHSTLVWRFIGTRAGVSLLVTSRLAGEVPVGELAGEMVMDRTTLSRNLTPLVRDGLLEVHPGDDGRTRLVRVTPHGEQGSSRDPAEAWRGTLALRGTGDVVAAARAGR